MYILTKVVKTWTNTIQLVINLNKLGLTKYKRIINFNLKLKTISILNSKQFLVFDGSGRTTNRVVHGRVN